MFIKIFIRNGNDQITAGFKYSDPVLQRNIHVYHMLQAMTRMNEVEMVIRHSLHVLGVSISNIPDLDFLHAQEHF